MTTETLLALAIAVLGGGHVWSWLTGRGKHQVDLITLGQSIAEQTILAMKQDKDELLARITALEAQIRELLDHAENLERTLERQGIEPPARPKIKVTR